MANIHNLGDIVEIVSGFAFKSDKFNICHQGLGIIRIQNVDESNTKDDFVYWSHAYLDKYLIKNGDLLLSLSGNVKLCIWDYDNSLLNQRIIKIIPKKDLIKKYLFFYLKATLSNIAELGKKAVISNISVNDIKKIKIPLPPLETQKQIALILDKADQLRKNCQKLEQEFNNLAQAVFIDRFGDYFTTEQFVKLGDIAEVVSGITKGQNLVGKETRQIPYMRVANVQAGYLNLKEIKTIEAKIVDISKYQLKYGDVLLTEGGDFDKLGRGALWRNEVENCIHQNHIFRVRLNENLYLPEWFDGYLQTDFVKKYFLKCAKKTTNLASINITQLKKLPIPVISLEAQNKFKNIITVICMQKQLIERLNIQLTDNFNALIQQAFSGQLTLKPKEIIA